MIVPGPGDAYGIGGSDEPPRPAAAEAVAAACAASAFAPGRGNKTDSSDGIHDVAFPERNSAPVRSITVAPDRCAACQLLSASSGEPVKKAICESSKLFSSSARMNAGSPPASVSVPA